MCSEKPKYHLEMFYHVKLAIEKIGVDMVYTLFSSTAISLADGIYVKQTLFSFFDAIKWCWYSGFKRTDMYYVVSFLAYQIFWCSNRAYFVTLTAYRWINSFFICWIQVSLRFSANFFWENTCLFFHFLQKAPCNIGFLHFFLIISTLDSYIRGTKVNFSSIFLFLIFKMWVWYICSDQFYSSFHDFKYQGSKLVSCKHLSAG